jgi:uncharacterized protein YjiK
MMKLKIVSVWLGVLLLAAWSLPVKELKHERWQRVQVKEPSDICFTPKGNTLYMVSDDGLLYETDLNGTILRQSPVMGVDFEGVHADADYVYVVDEFTRKIHQLRHEDLQAVRTVEVPYSGGRNMAYESITFNHKKGVFIIITEKYPIQVFELDASLRKINEVRFTGVRDVSAATWYNNELWLLSDEDRMVLRVDPQTYAIKERFRIPVINPEGLAFDAAGNLLVCSDDLRRLYFFPKF